ncbi:hypothetical protein FBZ92_13361 [Nitrospirillum viridazoti]|uniref:Uncharacterized protein n=1 Tax=Nitrospirillum amazonense TaxID=28077 RepID=A0A560HMC0_9PROT|nr:hypothetical protein FBZ92_13361 [Nitrospirillum amazonense]
MTPPLHSSYTHGYVWVAACTPPIAVADPPHGDWPAPSGGAAAAWLQELATRGP